MFTGGSQFAFVGVVGSGGSPLFAAFSGLMLGTRNTLYGVRLAGLLLLTATIFKVFLVDASELEGLLRILSFLGLGIALIGIARLYGPVLRAESLGRKPASSNPGDPASTLAPGTGAD